MHGLACPRHAGPLQTVGRLRSLVGRFDWVVADILGDEELLSAAGEGLPGGAALADAVAVRLRREGVELTSGEEVAARSIKGRDRYGLRRVSVHEADGVLAVLWKVLTGEGLPRLWPRLRHLREGTARVWGAGRSGGGAA